MLDVFNKSIAEDSCYWSCDWFYLSFWTRYHYRHFKISILMFQLLRLTESRVVRVILDFVLSPCFNLSALITSAHRESCFFFRSTSVLCRWWRLQNSFFCHVVTNPHHPGLRWRRAESSVPVLDIIDDERVYRSVIKGKKGRRGTRTLMERARYLSQGHAINLPQLCRPSKEIQRLWVSPSVPKMFITDPKQKAGHGNAAQPRF